MVMSYLHDAKWGRDESKSLPWMMRKPRQEEIPMGFFFQTPKMF